MENQIVNEFEIGQRLEFEHGYFVVKDVIIQSLNDEFDSYKLSIEAMCTEIPSTLNRFSVNLFILEGLSYMSEFSDNAPINTDLSGSITILVPKEQEQVQLRITDPVLFYNIFTEIKQGSPIYSLYLN